MSDGVYVFLEHEEGEVKEKSLLVLCEGRRLAERLEEELSVILVGTNLRSLLPQLNHYNVSKAFVVENALLEKYVAELYTDVLAQIATQYKPSIMLFPTTVLSSDLGSRVAARLERSLVANCKEFEVTEDGGLNVRKPICDERVDEVVTFLSEKPYIATVNPDFLELEKTKGQKEMQIIEFQPKIKENMVKIRSIGYVKADPKTVEVNEADVVIGIGKGLGAVCYLKVIEDLADLLCAPIGGTRIARDKGWIPYSRQIGISGKKISPKLYLALGISGSNHHIEGIRDSKIIVAVDIDRNAPIMKVSELGLIGDLHEVVPQLARILRARNADIEVSGK